MDLSKIKLFSFFPDDPEVRSDVADYYFEVQRFDSDVSKAIARLEEIGELENTIIVITGDHGMPFPRCKSNLYDSGTRVPLAIRWGQKIKKGLEFKDFVSLTDLAPTFLQAASVMAPIEMTGKSLLPALTGKGELRKFILTGKERHVPSQESPSMEGYPSRSYRDHEFLYIRNYSPNLWPNGTPNWQNATIKNTWYGDTDNGPTKSKSSTWDYTQSSTNGVSPNDRAKSSTISVTIQSNLKILRQKSRSLSPNIVMPLNPNYAPLVTHVMAAQISTSLNPPTQVVDHVFQENAN